MDGVVNFESIGFVERDENETISTLCWRINEVLKMILKVFQNLESGLRNRFEIIYTKRRFIIINDYSIFAKRFLRILRNI